MSQDDKRNTPGTPSTDLTEGYSGASTMRDAVGEVTGRYPDRPRDSGSSESAQSTSAPDNSDDRGTDEGASS